MKQTILNPTTVVRNYQNWHKESSKNISIDPHHKRIWYNLWGGSINDNHSFEIVLHTEKTVFDPSPYGWEVPAQGVESNWENTSNMIVPMTGRFRDGNLSDYNGNYAYYGLSTVYSSPDPSYYSAARCIRYSRSGFYTLDHNFGRSVGRVIRCVKNDAEPDYLKYLP